MKFTDTRCHFKKLCLWSKFHVMFIFRYMIDWVSSMSREHASGYMRRPCKGHGMGCKWLLLLLKPNAIERLNSISWWQTIIQLTEYYVFKSFIHLSVWKYCISMGNISNCYENIYHSLVHLKISGKLRVHNFMTSMSWAHTKLIEMTRRPNQQNLLY